MKPEREKIKARAYFSGYALTLPLLRSYPNLRGCMSQREDILVGLSSSDPLQAIPGSEESLTSAEPATLNSIYNQCRDVCASSPLSTHSRVG